jgi:uncharacterized protein YyaL (SSP411 family)
MLSATTLALERMAKGGVYDQLGGGFHRYSVDARWRVPHFEKMLYDNAQLLHLYGEAQQISPQPLWSKVASETVEYLRREMTSPEGGFYATQDADSEGEEGKFFVWKPEEINAVLPKELAALVAEHFGVTPQGNFEGGATVLEVAKPADALAERLRRPPAEVEASLLAARRQLFEAREKRIKPGRDEKILAGWNGLGIRGLSFAGRVFNRPDWIQHAKGAAELILSQMWQSGRLFRVRQDGVNRIDGLIEDYGNLAAGLTALYQASFDTRYLEAADGLVTRAVELFWDEDKQAYRSASKDQKDLFCPTYALHDNAFPSGASTLTEAQIALAGLTGQQRHLEQAGKYLRKMRQEMARNPFGYGHLWLAADSWLDGAAEVDLVGKRDQVQPLLDVINSVFAPTLAVRWYDQSVAAPAILGEGTEERVEVGGRAAAYLCRNFACQPPVTNPVELRLALNQQPSPA